MTGDLLPGNGSTDLLDSEAAYRERIRQLEERMAALTVAAAEQGEQAAAEVAAYQNAYTDRVGYLERQVAALTEAAIKREAEAVADRQAYQAAYAECNGDHEAQIAALTDAAALREAVAAADRQAYQAAYAERITYLETQVAVLTEAATRREKDIEEHNAAHAEQTAQLEKQIASYREAYKNRVGELEAQVATMTAAANERETRTAAEIAALTEATIERERQLQQRGETDYQLLMIHQDTLAEFKDVDPEFHGIYQRCRPFTMTSIERLYALYQSVNYLCASKIEGDFAECGVWQGGSCMLMALVLMGRGTASRQLWMFDTFAGHPQPDAERDVDLWGNRAIDEWRRHQTDGTAGEWGVASLAQVQANLASTGYPESRLRFVKGMVEKTVSDNIPNALALLRLDTDWYESTRVALMHLYPRLVSGGVMIIDDYGHYKGQRQAVDEYFGDLGQRPLLHRIDYSCRIMVKP